MELQTKYLKLAISKELIRTLKLTQKFFFFDSGFWLQLPIFAAPNLVFADSFLRHGGEMSNGINRIFNLPAIAGNKKK